jgi:hydroxypyruvate reductase/glycerate 2-kinase
MTLNIIKNYSELLYPSLTKSQLDLRKKGLESLELALKSVMPNKLMRQSLKIDNYKLIIQNTEFNLRNFEEILIIGGGKAVAQMAMFLDKIFLRLPKIKYRGLINIPEDLALKKLNISDSIKINHASHPIPSESGIIGVKRMIDLVKESSSNSLIIFLLSGGASALLPMPKRNITIEDLKIINSLLLKSGASIQEINIVRKHISDIKGGNLARIIFNSTGAMLLSLIISDVVGNNLESIGSGPTVPDSSTYKDTLGILKKYDLLNKIPNSISSLLKLGLKDQDLETPKPGDKCFNNVRNFLIGSVETAVRSVKKYLESENYRVRYFSNNIIGEARIFGKKLYKQYFNPINSKQKLSKKKALIGTGELTVTIQGNGIGGRNQEMLLSFLDEAKDVALNGDFILLAANLDGIEGNSKAMGAIIDNRVINEIITKKIDLKNYIFNNDSNSLFKLIGTEIVTGPTGCNVNDIMIFLYNPKGYKQ